MVVAEKHNPAIPVDVITQIALWMNQGATIVDVVDRLRPQTVPPGYIRERATYLSTLLIHVHAVHYTGVPLKEEEVFDKMRAVIAQYEFSYEINKWEERGVPFKTHL